MLSLQVQIELAMVSVTRSWPVKVILAIGILALPTLPASTVEERVVSRIRARLLAVLTRDDGNFASNGLLHVNLGFVVRQNT